MIARAIAVVDVAGAEIDWTTINHGRHAVHLVTAEQGRLNAGLTNAVHVDRFDFLGCPIGPVVVIVGDGKTERVFQVVGDDARYLCVSVET